MTVSEKTNQETLTRPPGKWFNWYRSTLDGRDIDGADLRVGDDSIDPRPWPTREVAEQKHYDLMRTSNALRRRTKYLGAYPEGVTP